MILELSDIELYALFYANFVFICQLSHATWANATVFQINVGLVVSVNVLSSGRLSSSPF